MFGLKNSNARGLIGQLRKRGMTLEQIANALAPDHQARPVSRVTLSKILSGDRSGIQLVDRLCALLDGEPVKPERSGARGVASSPRPHPARREARRTTSEASQDTGLDIAPTPLRHRQPTSSTERYWRDRAAGKTETEALSTVRRDRASQRQQAEQQRQDEQLQAYTILFMGEARRRLSMGGFYSESDVQPVARELARAYLHQQQQPRLPDAMPKRLASPKPFRLPPEQRAEFVWMGRLRRPAFALGDGYAAAHEQAQTTVQALITRLIRQPVPADETGE